MWVQELGGGCEVASHHYTQDTCKTCVSCSHNFKCCWSISFRSQGRNAVATGSVEEVETATWSLVTYVTAATGQVGDCYCSGRGEGVEIDPDDEGEIEGLHSMGIRNVCDSRHPLGNCLSFNTYTPGGTG